MALPENRKAVMAILDVLEPQILGKTHPGFKCNCGAIDHGPAVAVEIDPGGDEYPGQEVSWSMWTVRHRHHPEDPTKLNGFGTGLSYYINVEELNKLFRLHFGSKTFSYPYNLEVSGMDRIERHLPMAVRMLDNDGQTRFCFDWGRDQEPAKQLLAILKKNPGRIPNKSKVFEKIYNLLSTFSPVTYRGGPDPELPFESKWLLDYEEALEIARGAEHVFVQNISGFDDEPTAIDVVFMKYHLD